MLVSIVVRVSAQLGIVSSVANDTAVNVDASLDVRTVFTPAGVADGVTIPGGAADNGAILTGFEDLEAVLSPETAAASKAASAANGAPAHADVAAPSTGVSLLGGLVTAKSKASIERQH